MRWTLEKASKKDFARINALFVEMLQTIYNTDNVEGYATDSLDRFFDGRDEWICTAISEGEIIAFLSIEVHHEKEEYIYIDDFSVTKNCRGMGIGKALMMRVEEYAKELKITDILLHVEKTNSSAYSLYKSLGYSVFEDQGSRYLMGKALSHA